MMYGETRGIRRRQILGDVGVVVWVALWVWIGLGLRDQISQLAESGRLLEGAGDRLSNIGGSVEDLPVIGEALQDAAEAVMRTGRSLTQAGVAQQDVVAALALWLPVIIVALAIGYAVVPYLVWRIWWVRNARVAKQLRDQTAGWVELFALRALTNRSLRTLRRVEPDPHAAYAAGRLRPLAHAELRALGLAPPAE